MLDKNLKTWKTNILEKIEKCRKLTVAVARWIMRDTKKLIFETFHSVFNCKRNEVSTSMWLFTCIASICVSDRCYIFGWDPKLSGIKGGIQEESLQFPECLPFLRIFPSTKNLLFWVDYWPPFELLQCHHAWNFIK